MKWICKSNICLGLVTTITTHIYIYFNHKVQLTTEVNSGRQQGNSVTMTGNH